MNTARLQAELDAIRNRRKKRRLTRSKLDRYRGELVALQRLGASHRDMAEWLKRKHVTITPSSIGRRLKQWNAEREAPDA